MQAPLDGAPEGFGPFLQRDLTSALLAAILLAWLAIFLPFDQMGLPSERLQRLPVVPWRAAAILAVVNVLIVALTYALFCCVHLPVPRARIQRTFVAGAAGSILAWIHMGQGLPLTGMRHRPAVLAGMSPYLLIAVPLFATLTTPNSPGGSLRMT